MAPDPPGVCHGSVRPTKGRAAKKIKDFWSILGAFGWVRRLVGMWVDPPRGLCMDGFSKGKKKWVCGSALAWEKVPSTPPQVTK